MFYRLREVLNITQENILNLYLSTKLINFDAEIGAGRPASGCCMAFSDEREPRV